LKDSLKLPLDAVKAAFYGVYSLVKALNL